ncbi:MAG: hypothetical protein AB7G11_05020 [Phycisphaerales bacterium]
MGEKGNGRSAGNQATARLEPPRTPAALLEWLRRALKVDLATTPLLEGNSAPFEYVSQTFFEGRRFGDESGRMGAFGPADVVVWANRGGGKTFLGAVATMLDLVFKPGIEIRILGGSLEQSQRMHEHLRRLFEAPMIASMLDGPIKARSLQLRSGSRAQVLAQSHTSVRGTRVQKVRCDETELFDPDVWEAAQLTTRSMRLAGPWGSWVRGSVEALSTMHKPYGLMWNIVSEASLADAATHSSKRRLIRWGVVDVLEACGDEFRCDACSLFAECGGRAKMRTRISPSVEDGNAGRADGRSGGGGGHVSIDDAVRMKSRVSEDVWRAEMLCRRPRRSDSVYPEFDAGVHVGNWDSLAAEHTKWIAGMDFGFRAPTVVLLARVDEGSGVVYIEAEHIRAEWTLDQHITPIKGGMDLGLPAPAWIGVDPAGHQRSEQTGMSSIAALRRAGLIVRSRRLELHEGVSLVRARLRPAGTGEGATPTLFIHQRCGQLIEALQRYHYPEDRPESLQPVKDGFDHAADALRYMIVNLDRPHRTTCGSYL